jgi:hypothetical protein
MFTPPSSRHRQQRHLDQFTSTTTYLYILLITSISYYDVLNSTTPPSPVLERLDSEEIRFFGKMSDHIYKIFSHPPTSKNDMSHCESGHVIDYAHVAQGPSVTLTNHSLKLPEDVGVAAGLLFVTNTSDLIWIVLVL